MSTEDTIIARVGYDPADDADNGNRFFTGNGYMGIRGTLPEFGADRQVAVNLAGIYHRKGDGWREPLNAPNPFYAQVSGASLPGAKAKSHRIALDIADGVFSRETVFDLPGGALTIRQSRFCSLDRVHVAASRTTLVAEVDMDVVLTAGIDEDVWDIHGPHYERVTHENVGGAQLCRAFTDQRQQVAVALMTTICTTRIVCQTGGLSRYILPVKANEPFSFDAIAAVYTSNDESDPGACAVAALSGLTYEHLMKSQRAAWSQIWADARVEIDGDAHAQFAINYSLYHLISIAPRHASNLSVAARGLSGQTYKGAIFWDTEMFMLDFYLNAMPLVARSALKYRIDTLPGALEKAREYGLPGAFYAWESQENGIEGCSDYNVTDVFTGRPMRTHFRDKQVHISAAIAYALIKYLNRTDDETLMSQGGARVLCECANFYLGLISKRILADEYDLNDVVGPDEYHERVNNNAYTNEMARMVLAQAAHLCPRYLPDLPAGLIASFEDAARKLKRQAPDAQTGIIEQFDGYFALEDATVDTVRGRLIDPREYWGGAYGVAAQTQVIKQADVVAMLVMLNGYPPGVIEANYDYYMPRTEHGSSLSACMYALTALKIGRPDEAYPLFMKSAEADISGGGKAWAGLVYIGGTHPAAAGGAYMALVSGFLGVTFDGDRVSVSPTFPPNWRRVRLTIRHRGRRLTIDATPNRANVEERANEEV